MKSLPRRSRKYLDAPLGHSSRMPGPSGVWIFVDSVMLGPYTVPRRRARYQLRMNSRFLDEGRRELADVASLHLPVSGAHTAASTAAFIDLARRPFGLAGPRRHKGTGRKSPGDS